MAYCMNCGKELPDGAKFCAECGTSIGSVQKPEEKRETVYEGKLFKCPNCGEVLNSFTANCPTCGHELRGMQATSAVRELATKIEAIESERKSRSRGLFIKKITQVDEKKISLIRNFSIPNTREDLYEFLILSKSNINVELYENDSPMMKGDARVAVSDAWKAKFEQAYQKAKLVFVDDSKMIEIQRMYDDIHKSIKKAKTKTWRVLGISFGVIFVVLILEFALIGGLLSSGEKDKEREVARLNEVVVEIENALEDNDYRLALMHADSLCFRESDSDLERDWKIKRDYWIDKIIDEAAQNGIKLEKPIDRTNDDVQPIETDTKEGKTEDSFTNGYNDAMEESKEEIQKNVDEFYKNLNGDESLSPAEQ